jgi:exodeoxyribonuclease V
MGKVVLTPSQTVALKGLKRWYHSNMPSAILHGAAGFGKTFLISELLKELGPSVNPLLLAETHEAVKVFSNMLGGNYEARTVCSALGLAMTVQEDIQVLVRQSVPDLSDFNLLIVDESSQLDAVRLQYLQDCGIFVLYVGHKSQLPPVNVQLKTNDLCLSPVFLQDYPTFHLSEPVRNTGSIFTFCVEAERLIYTRGVLDASFRVPKNFFKSYLETAKEELLENETVFLAYTNARVDELNDIARIAIFGREVEENFLPADRLIFRSNASCFEAPLLHRASVAEYMKAESIAIPTNSRAVVLRKTYKDILGIACYELYVEILTLQEAFKGYVYVAVAPNDKALYKRKLYNAAMYEHNVTLRQQKWKAYHDLDLIVCNVKHGYALTVHCSQGSTINNVFVDDIDIGKCNNSVLRRKLAYVAYSRAKNNLYRLGVN